ncbi:MAG: YqhA family protein [Devosia sp.]|uniref:YqhA family protein n=1 Tax=Devosia sp. TaxID=1871048 RepID=UPI001A60C7CD|nr:YqhA family protein [Devosia sp.]MBL8598204.1 YqhA family protein [Devosia sp.]
MVRSVPEPKAIKERVEAAREASSSGPFVIGGFAVRTAMLVAVIALMVTAVALIVYGVIDTWRFLAALFDRQYVMERDEALLHAIVIVDLFLLATVVQVVSLGLYQLYFRQDLKLPRWLKIGDLDDLKSKLVGVCITVMAVFFLGKAIIWDAGIDILYLGGAVAMVIVALTYFLSRIEHHRE